jgi:hypothetical protein
MAKKFDVVVAQRYVHNGEERKKYLNIGAVLEGQNGPWLKLDTIPIGWDGKASFYEPKPREEQQQERQAPPPSAKEPPPFDDDLPF